MSTIVTIPGTSLSERTVLLNELTNSAKKSLLAFEISEEHLRQQVPTDVDDLLTRNARLTALRAEGNIVAARYAVLSNEDFISSYLLGTLDPYLEPSLRVFALDSDCADAQYYLEVFDLDHA